MEEYRNGVLFSRSNRDFQVSAADCQVSYAALPETDIIQCEDLTIEFENQSFGADDYLWDFGDGGSSTEEFPVYTYDDYGTYEVSLVINLTHACHDTIWANVHIVPPPVVDIDLDIDCDLLFVDASASATVTAPDNITAYFWDFGDGSTSTQSSPSHTYASGGSYTITLVTETFGGCLDTVSRDVLLGGASVSQDEYISCDGFTIDFMNTSSGATSFFWDFGDGTTSTEENPSHTYPGIGTYDVTLLVDQNEGCTDTVYATAIILPPTQAGFDVSVDCDSREVTLQNATNTPIENPVTDYEWDFGDGSTSTQQNPVHTYAAAGNYTITLTVLTQEGCTVEYSEDVFITGGASTSQPSYLDCDDRTIQFTNTTAAATGFLWDFGDGSTSTQENPSHTYAGYGTYNVTLLVQGGTSCTDTVYLDAIVVEPPVAAFQPDPNCVTLEIALTDNSVSAPENPITGYSWNFGDGNTSAQQSPVHTYAAAGNYTVTLTIETEGGCSAQVSEDIFFTGGASVSQGTYLDCDDRTIQFESTTPAAQTYSWNFGDGNTSNEENPEHTYAGYGTFDVSLIINEGGSCSDTVLATAVVVPPPTSDFGVSVDCDLKQATFTNASVSDPENPITGYSWNFGDGNTSSDQNPVHTYAQAGAYTVTLTIVTQGGCSAVHSEDIFLTGPVSTTEPSYLDCDDQTIQFLNNTEAALNFFWDFGDGGTSTEENPVHTYADYGTYDVSLLVNAGEGCTDTVFLTAVVVPPPVADFSVELDCDLRQITLTESASSDSLNPITAYSWDFGDGGTSSVQNPVHTYGGLGVYDITLEVNTQGGCTALTTQSLVIGAGPQADFNDGEICVGTNWDFQNLTTYPDGVVATYFWNVGGAVTEAFEIEHLFSTSGTYDVSLIAVPEEDYACTDTLTRQMVVRDSLVPSILVQEAACEGDNVAFENNTAGFYESVLWNFGDGATSGSFSPNHTYTSPGNYNWQVVMANTACGAAELSGEIEIREIPVIFLEGDGRDICEGVLDSFEIDISAYPGASVQWSTGDTTPFIYFLGGPQELSVVVTYQGCTSEPASINLTSKCEIYIPSAFSPNGFNNAFNVIPKNIDTYELRIYNRWGELVFETSDFNRGWDGRFKSVDAPMDTYVYLLEATKIDRKAVKKTGMLMLLR